MISKDLLDALRKALGNNEGTTSSSGASPADLPRVEVVVPDSMKPHSQTIDLGTSWMSPSDSDSQDSFSSSDSQDSSSDSGDQQDWRDFGKLPSPTGTLSIDDAMKQISKNTKMSADERKALLKYLYSNPLTSDKVKAFTDYFNSPVKYLNPSFDQYLTGFNSQGGLPSPFFGQKPSGPPPGFSDAMKSIQAAAGQKAAVKDNQDGTVTVNLGGQSYTDTPQAVLSKFGGSNDKAPAVNSNQRSADRDINHLYGPIRPKVQAVVDGMNKWLKDNKQSGQTVVGEGLRSAPYQNWIYNGRPGDQDAGVGKLTARDGYTHESDHQSGLAVDVMLKDKNGQPIWDESKFPKGYLDELHRLTIANGLESGQDWKRPDLMHIQWPESDAATYAAGRKWLGLGPKGKGKKH